MKIVYYYTSPIGILKLVCTQEYLEAISFTNERKEDSVDLSPVLSTCIEQLDQYFRGKRENFDIPINFTCGTPFQQNIWKALQHVGYGETKSYKDIATCIGNPKAVRAVGGANNKNPIVIVIPCHRVIGSNGKLVGFAGGLEKKEWLLTHEKGNKR